jgi:predicted dehydrogenase
MTNDILVSGVFSAGTSESHDLEFYGDGRVRLSCYHADGLEKFGDLGASRFTAGIQKLAALMLSLPRRFMSRWDGGEMLACYRAQWTHFIQCIEDDKPVECDLYDGRRAVEIAVAAIESASAHRPVKLAVGQKGA